MPRIKNLAGVAKVVNEEQAVVKKSDVFKITARFKVRTKDGDRVSYRFTGQSKDILEALKLVGEDPEEYAGKPLPKGLNMLVTVTLDLGDYTFTRAFAPHVFKSIFEENNYKLFFKLMLSQELFNKYVSA